MESLIADAAQSGDVRSSVDGIKEQRDRLLDDVNRYKMGKGQFQKIMLEKGVAIKPMATSLLDMENSVASSEAEKELSLKKNAELVSTGRRQGARGSRMEEDFIETVPPMYLGFTFHVEKVIVTYFSR